MRDMADTWRGIPPLLLFLRTLSYFFRLKSFYILKACCMLCRSRIALRQTWEFCSFFLSEIVECYVLLCEDMFMCPFCTCVCVRALVCVCVCVWERDAVSCDRCPVGFNWCCATSKADTCVFYARTQSRCPAGLCAHVCVCVGGCGCVYSARCVWQAGSCCLVPQYEHMHTQKQFIGVTVP